MSGIVLESVRKEFAGGVVAVNDLNLEIEQGEFVALVGPSGCGKTTTLRMVAGLEEITSGEITINDRVVNAHGAAPARHRDGVPELRPLCAHERAAQHGLRPEDGRHAQGRDPPRVSTMPRRCSSVTKLLERKPRQLSGGERQRVAMGRAIVREPRGVPDGRAAVEPRRQAAGRDARRDRQRAAQARRHRRSTSRTTRSRR